MKIIEDDLLGDEIRRLLQTHFDLMRSQSPEESCHVLPIDDLKHPSIKFWSIWNDGALLGCGALKDLGDGHGEIKSMHVYKHLRGKGISRKILIHIIDCAMKNGFEKLSLETGSFDEFMPARKLYESFGFEECEPFGDYVKDPNSVFMTKAI